MEFRYENQGSASFLVCKLEETEQLEEISLGMLKNNQLPCVLPVAYVQVDDQRNLRWNISSKINLESFLDGRINRTRLLNVFSSICEAVESSEDYLLDDSLFCMDKKYIFCDVSTGRTSLLYIPVIREEEPVDIISFAREVMLSAHFQEGEDNGYVATIMNNLNRPSGLSVAEFAEIIRDLKARTDQPMGRAMPGGRVPLPPQKSGFGTRPAPGGMAAPQMNMPDRQAAYAAPPQNSWSAPEPYPQPVAHYPEPSNAQDNTTLLTPQMEKGGRGAGAPAPQPQAQPSFGGQYWNAGGQAPQPQAQPSFGGQYWNAGGQAPQPQAQPSFGGQAPQPQAQPSFGGQSWSAAPPTRQPQPEPSFGGGQVWNPGGPVQQPRNSFGGGQTWNPSGAGQNQPQAQPSFGGQFWSAGAPAQPSGSPSGVPLPRNSFGIDKGGGSHFQSAKALDDTTVLNPGAYPQRGGDYQGYGGNDLYSAKSDTTVLTPASSPLPKAEGRHIAVASLRRIRTGQTVEIRKDLFHIGTEKSYADLCIVDNSAISRSHADLICRDGKYFLRDTNSLNHTYLNGAMLTSNTEYELRSGDTILLANEEFEFKVR